MVSCDMHGSRAEQSALPGAHPTYPGLPAQEKRGRSVCSTQRRANVGDALRRSLWCMQARQWCEPRPSSPTRRRRRGSQALLQFPGRATEYVRGKFGARLQHPAPRVCGRRIVAQRVVVARQAVPRAEAQQPPRAAAAAAGGRPGRIVAQEAAADQRLGVRVPTARAACGHLRKQQTAWSGLVGQSSRWTAASRTPGRGGAGIRCTPAPWRLCAGSSGCWRPPAGSCESGLRAEYDRGDALCEAVTPLCLITSSPCMSSGKGRLCIWKKLIRDPANPVTRRIQQPLATNCHTLPHLCSMMRAVLPAFYTHDR